MTNIYIKPNTNITPAVNELKAYMHSLWEELKPGSENISFELRNKGRASVYPRITVDNLSIAILLDVFYRIHYMPSLEENDDQRLLLEIDAIEQGEKSLAEVLEDAKTAVEYIKTNMEAAADE